DGQVLTADSASAGGVKWANAAGGGGSSAKVAATNNGTTSVDVSGVSVLVLNSGATVTFNLTLTSLTAGQIIIVENKSGHTANLDTSGNVVIDNNNARLLYAD